MKGSFPLSGIVFSRVSLYFLIQILKKSVTGGNLKKVKFQSVQCRSGGELSSVSMMSHHMNALMGRDVHLSIGK